MIVLAVGTASAVLFLAGIEHRLPSEANTIAVSEDLATTESADGGLEVTLAG